LTVHCYALQQFSLASTTLPDPDAKFELFDRVVNVRHGYTVPFGLRGTIIGVVTAAQSRDIEYEIVFDEEFPCGLTTR